MLLVLGWLNAKVHNDKYTHKLPILGVMHPESKLFQYYCQVECLSGPRALRGNPGCRADDGKSPKTGMEMMQG